jgi:diguanylate cyclase
MLTPLVSNIILLLIGIWAMHFSNLKQKVKIYFISLLFVGICFVFFSVHSIFDSLYLIFTVPILLTVVYSNYFLTTVTSCISIAAKSISELFIKWDSDKIDTFSTEAGITNFLISICIFVAFYAVCIIVIRFEKEKNIASIQKEIQRHQLQQELITDELTRVYNRTALRNALENMENDRFGNTYYFSMIDLDNFKTLNDTLGHDKGDQCLKEFGSILKNYYSDDLLPFRFGGDEFCLLFKNITLDRILEICKCIQTDFKQSTACHSNIPLTVSIGIARYEKPMSATQLIRNTDSALYRSKDLKDAICVFEDMNK